MNLQLFSVQLVVELRESGLARLHHPLHPLLVGSVLVEIPLMAQSDHELHTITLKAHYDSMTELTLNSLRGHTNTLNNDRRKLEILLSKTYSLTMNCGWGNWPMLVKHCSNGWKAEAA